MSLFPIFAPATAAGPAIATHVAGVSNTSAASTWTQSDEDIGTASSDRVIVIATHNDGYPAGTDITGVTIGGSAMTQLGEVGIVEGRLEMWALAYPSGTTATFVTTYAASTNPRAMHIFSLTGTGGATTVSELATHAGPNAGNSNHFSSLNLDVPENGTVIAASFNQAYSNGGAWTGVDFDNRINATGNQFFEAASKDFTAASEGLLIKRDWTTGQRVGMIAASFGPA